MCSMKVSTVVAFKERGLCDAANQQVDFILLRQVHPMHERQFVDGVLIVGLLGCSSRRPVHDSTAAPPWMSNHLRADPDSLPEAANNVTPSPTPCTWAIFSILRTQVRTFSSSFPENFGIWEANA